MLKLAARKIATLSLSLLGSSLVIFTVCQALPGDVARVILGDGASDAALAQVRAEYGLDQPWLVRYVRWLSELIDGSFGISYFTHDTVSSLIAPRLAVTLPLACGGIILALIIAIPIGIIAARYRRSNIGFATTFSSQLGMAVPAFWAALLLILLFSINLKWLPANGYVAFSENPIAWLSHLALPIVSLALVQSAVLVRYIRLAMIDVFNQDYYRTARSVGWRPWPAIWRHGLRNIALNLGTVIGMQFAAVLVGAIVLESVFALPGLGSLLLDAVARHDLMVLQGTVMFLAATILVINTLIDLSYFLIDPRIRGGRA